MNKSKTKKASFNWGKLSFQKPLKYISYIGAVILILVLICVLFPDFIINTFLKGRITKAITEVYPEYKVKFGDLHYNIWKNRLGCDSITLKTRDSAATCRIASLSVSGIGWIKILWQNDFTYNNLTNSVIDAKNIVLNLNQSQNEFRFGILHISVPDSEITVDSIKYYSLLDDERFFAKSKFRQTRIRLDIPQVKIKGLDYPAIFKGNIYKAGNIDLQNLNADILVNMDKPYDKNSSNPQMPNEVLSSMKEIIKIDILKIIDGRLKYCEQYAVRSTPGLITCNRVNVSVSGITNDPANPHATVVNAEGLFMNSSSMKLLMKIPLTSKDFSLQYSGSLRTMDINRLNSFLEKSDHIRIKSGVLNSAMFNINVNSGYANGTLKVFYKDLDIAILSKNTGGEKGFFDQISSLVGKTFIIRGSNELDEDGLMKIGEIKYRRNPDDYFMQFIWFALRSGVGDVVGF